MASKDEKTKGFHQPFSALRPLREALPSQQPERRAEDFPETPPEGGPERVTLRRETGRDGEELTVVEGLGLGPPQLRTWLEALQRGLACRGSVEDTRLVLRGDHRFTLPDLLLRRGVRRVVHG